MKKPPKIWEYDGKGDHDEHIQLVNDRMNYFSNDKASNWKFFVLTLFNSTKMYFNGLPDESIQSWTNFCEWFSVHFTI